MDTHWARNHLAWMAKKDALNQDMFLLGSHGPLRRRLAFKFCELHSRECEYVALTADTSEADLKARRELRRSSTAQTPPGATGGGNLPDPDRGGGGSPSRSPSLAVSPGPPPPPPPLHGPQPLSVVWDDQAVVRAAVLGRVLILEGLEKAERNVLPVLNNLLENREMQLEDGRFLVAPKRYDALVAQGRIARGRSSTAAAPTSTDAAIRAATTSTTTTGTTASPSHAHAPTPTGHLVRVSERFRVIAVGVPSPPFPGNPLDPPLRSRFSARHVSRAPTADLLQAICTHHAPTVPLPKLQQLLTLYEAIWALGEQQGSASGAESRAVAFSALVYPCEQAVLSACRLMEALPAVGAHEALARVFPATAASGMLDGEAQALVTAVLCTTTEALGSEAELGFLRLPSTSLVRVEASDSRLPAQFGARPPTPAPAQQGDGGFGAALPFPSPSPPRAEPVGAGAVVTLHFSSQPADGMSVAAAATVAGPSPPHVPALSVLLPGQSHVLGAMLASAAVGRDVCLIGARGEGKSFVARCFAAALGYDAHVETLFLFDDMSARDLFARRSTNALGESIWQPSALGAAMLHGRLCVLDGLHRLHESSLSALARLLQDRECDTPDGTRWVSPLHWDHLVAVRGIPEATLLAGGIRRVHPAFRVVGLAIPRAARRRKWLSNEVLQLFHFFVLPPAGEAAQLVPIVRAVVPACPLSIVQALVQVRRQLLAAAAAKNSPLWVGAGDQVHHAAGLLPNPDGDGADGRGPPELPAGAHPVCLSLRAVLRAARRAAAAPAGTDLPRDVGASIEAALMVDFMPAAERAAVRAILKEAGLALAARALKVAAAKDLRITEADLGAGNPVGHVSIGSDAAGWVRAEVTPPTHAALVPDTLFFDIPQAKLVLMDMLRDFNVGDHMLLMGNQGVGKNKISDRLLMLLHREREYIQLHRDTTVGSLTLLPSLRNGVVHFSDSPLVKAMRYGRVLVVDEFDKAPTEVVIVLKALLEDGDILLGDGRRFVRAEHPMARLAGAVLPHVHLIHPGFLVIALANRPGFPFLGNDFFREMSDSFACHAVQNPDAASEVQLLRSYGPNLPVKMLHVLAAAFGELREATEAGKLSYPYSTREAVAIVRHLSAFPGDSVASVLENVFAFDAYDPQLRTFLFGVFSKHGIPLGADSDCPDGAVPSQLAAVAPLRAPQVVGRIAALPSGSAMRRLLQTRRTSGGVGADAHSFSATQFVAKPFALDFGGCVPWEARWRAVSPEAAEDMGGVDSVLTVGQAGAEWGPLTWHSARAECFTEEELWFRIACVTRDGVMIEGSDPQRGSWLGHMVGMAAAQNTVCVLTTMQCLFVADIDNRRLRKLSLAVRPFGGLKHRARFAGGQSLLSVDNFLVVFDQHNEVLLKVWPADGRIVALGLPPPAAGVASAEHPCHCAGVLRTAGEGVVVVLFSVGGHELVFASLAHDSSGRAPGLRLQLSAKAIGAGGLLEVVCTSGASLLLTCATEHRQLELSWVGQVLDASTQRTLRRLAMQGVDPQLQFCSLVDGAANGRQWVTSPTLLTAFRASTNTNVLVGFPRDCEPAKGPVSPSAVGWRNISLWHAPSGSVVNITADVASTWVDESGSETAATPIAVAHGKVYAEVVDVNAPHMRRIVLTQFPGKGAGAKSTGGDLTGRALLVTDAQKSRDATRKVTKQGMAACVAGCTLDDGRLALLFADGHVRVLEVRLERLRDGEAQHFGLAGLHPSTAGWGNTGPSGNGDDSDWEGNGDGSGRGGGNGTGVRTGIGNGRRTGRLDSLLARMRLGSEATTQHPSRLQSEAAAADVLRKARELVAKTSTGARAEKDLADLELSAYDEIYQSVEALIAQLRVVLGSVEAKEKERVWLRGKTSGEMDDSRLVDLAIGEKNVFKKRGVRDESLLVQRLPKRLSFVVDVSGSMAYFNSDLRLDRLCATVVMLMESLVGMEHKYVFEIVGHSGETHHLPLVDFGAPPRNRKDRLAVVNAMVAHAAVCQSGDNTLAAATRAVRDVRSAEADDYFVFLVSDANLEGYGVTSSSLASALLADVEVNAFAIFIAEPEVALEMADRMPAGRAHLVMENDGMPLLFKDIFSRALLRSKL